jgi:poly(A) polymerase
VVASPGNVAPRILSRAEHVVSRKNIDPDAVRVLYRLKAAGFVAYLVGGGVRDLLLGRQPKDFDIGTSAHPQQVRKLFRNCFIVGRRFRLAHVRFGPKLIEVSTFRRAATPEEAGDPLIRRDNTFGTPEEDAFRRDFTVNALFYDIATFSVIDWVGGLADLQARMIRTIGDPAVRFREDPVRMLRAVAIAARLEFAIDRDTQEAIRALRGEIVRSSPARILEEFYKILRQGRSRETFALLHEYGLLAYLLPAADRALAGDGGPLLGSLSRLDEFRRAAAGAERLGNALLLGSLLVPLGLPPPRRRQELEADGEQEEEDDEAAEFAGKQEEKEPRPARPHRALPLELPFARRDIERLRLVLAAQRRLRQAQLPASVRRALAARHYFEESLTWLEIHGGAEGRELVAEWRGLVARESESEGAPETPSPAPAEPGATAERRGHRRRRRRRRRPHPPRPEPN